MKNGEGTGGVKFRRKGPDREDRMDGINNAEVAWLKEYLTQVHEDWHEERMGFYLHQARDSCYDNWVLSAMTITMYRDNVRRSKVKEAVDTIDAIKDLISSYVSDKGRLPPLATTTSKSSASSASTFQTTEDGNIGSGIMESSSLGLEPPWGKASGEDGFDAHPKST